MSQGLDATANAKSRAQKIAQAKPIPPEDVPLDPPFPYRVIQGNPQRFGTVADPASLTQPSQ